MSTFDALIADLTRDAHRVQPKDALQFCANWFQARLEEQRTRTRDTLANRLTPIRDLPTDHFFDTPLSPTSSGIAGSPFSQAFPPERSSMPNLSTSSPFGTLNVPGNALLPDTSANTRNVVSPPTFTINGDSISPISPNTPDPFASFANGSVSPNDSNYLHPSMSTILARRSSVSAESIAVDSESDEPLPVFPKSPEQLRRILASVGKSLLFRELDEEQQTGVLNAMREQSVEKDEVVILQGDVGEYFYVVESGLLHCYIRDPPLPPDWFNKQPSGASTNETFVRPGHHPKFGRKVAECGVGSTFGELALMYGHPRSASVVAIEPCTLWTLDRITFRTIILKAAHRRRTMYEQFLASVPLLKSLGPEERSKIADALGSSTYEDGESVVRQGDMGDTFFFIEEGEAIVTKMRDDGTEVEVLQLRKGDYFGGMCGHVRLCRCRVFTDRSS
jgi:cAMP-dependent protein kinase regulator